MERAASLMLLSGDGDVRVLLGRRARGTLLDGTLAFPGGRVTEGDAAPSASIEGGGEDRALRVAAVREAFEETSVLAVPGAGAIPAERLSAARAALRDGSTSLGAVLEAEGLHLDLDAVVPAGTPRLEGFVVPGVEIALHLMRLPGGAADRIDPDPAEVAEAGWYAPREVLADWAAGTEALAESVRRPLEALVGGAGDAGDTLARALRAITGESQDRLGHEIVRGVALAPVHTPTLPPATHTNCYVLGTGEARIVVDPASPWDEAQAALDAYLDGLAADGAHVREIWLTHHHFDHVGGAAHLKARLGVPVRAHPETAARVEAGLVDAAIEGGDTTPHDGPLAQSWRAVFTPGHAPGHLCFFDETTGAAVVGDLMAGVGTIVIDPPEGNMQQYFDSLAAVRALGASTVFPAHGPPTRDAAGIVDAYVSHRHEREEAIVEGLAHGEKTIPELVERVYTDVPKVFFGLAGRNVLAHLEKLEVEGRVVRGSGETEKVAWRVA